MIPWQGTGELEEGETKEEVRHKVIVVVSPSKNMVSLVVVVTAGGVESREAAAMEGVGFEGEEGAGVGGTREIKVYRRIISIFYILKEN